MCLTIAGDSVCVSASEFPYGAKVAARTATVRSGPSSEYYATDRLPSDSRVEVYRHDGDWAAIRPPAGSFSWVPASAIELTEDTTHGYVAYEGVRIRVGSRLNDQRSAEYVELKADEEVTVIARRTLDVDGTPERWYQIEPAPGEFRWVQLSSLQSLASPLPQTDGSAKDKTDSRKQLDSQSELADPVSLARFVEESPDRLESDTPGTSDSNFELPETKAAETNPSDVDPQDVDPQDLDVPTDRQTLDQTPNAPPFKTRPIDGVSTPATKRGAVLNDQKGPWKLDTPNQDQQVPIAAQPNDANAAAASGFRSGFRRRSGSVDPTLLQQELAKINLELTRQIVRDPTHWRLGEFRSRTQAVIDLGSANTLREEAQVMLSRITQFEDIKRRHTDLARDITDGFLDRSDLADFGTPADLKAPSILQPMTMPPPVASSQTAGSAYDGTGWLMPVVTRQVGVPRYALTDDTGNILHFVSPRPGLNLHHYERRRIGIIGQKGFVPRYNKPHLTVERIISLDKIRR